MVRVLAVVVLLMLSLNIAVPVIMAEENVFYGVAFIGPSVVDDVKVYLGNIGGDEVYVRIVFENLGETYESKCIKAETHRDIKIMESKDNKILISIYSDGVSGLIRDVSSFIALKNKEKAIEIHREASRKLIESRIIEKDKDLQTSEQQELYKHQIIKELQQTATQSGEAEYGRFGYIQGKEGNTLWKIYMDVFGQIRPDENYNELERGSSKYFRAEFLTTQQWPYPEWEPMIWQGNAFKVYILTSSSLLNPTDPYPESDKDAVSIPLYLYIQILGLYLLLFHGLKHELRPMRVIVI